MELNGAVNVLVRTAAHRASQKRLGRFYTPEPVATALTTWALRAGSDRVLDPSYGGCAFLGAAIERLSELGSPRAVSQVYGIDVDGSAVKYLHRLPGIQKALGNFLTKDYLEVRASEFGLRFHAIVGNPPFVRHHALTAQQIEMGQRSLGGGAAAIPRTAGYWAYFVFHSLSFLAPGGRLALVLPAAFLNAAYAGSVREALENRFESVHIALVAERLFPEAQEAALLLLAEGFSSSRRAGTLSVLPGVAAIRAWCASPVSFGVPFSLSFNGRAWKKHLLAADATSLLDRLGRSKDVKPFHDLASVKIGVVTGANRFFVISPTDAARLRIPSSALTPVVDSASSIRSLTIGKREINQLRRSDCDCLLVLLPPGSESARVRAYARTKAGRIASTTGKCRERRPWYRLTDTAAPDAFATYVNGGAPRLALNAASVLSTNAVHRVWWKWPMTSNMAKTVALSFLTSLTGLSAEIHGRSYGGGALKLEPGDLAELLVAVPALSARVVRRGFREASRMLASGNWKDARALADKTILQDGMAMSEADTTVLAAAQDRLHDLRVSTRAAPA